MKVMAIFASILFYLLSAFLPCALAGDDYFPQSIFNEQQELDREYRDYYATYLRAMGEPSMYGQSKDTRLTVYRFIWLRSFINAVAVRVNINKDGSGMLTAKMTSGTGGSGIPGNLINNIEKKLPKTTIDELLRLIKKKKFWVLRPTSKKFGLDGSTWIIEGLSNGKYRVVKRWLPEATRKEPVANIGLFFMQLSGFDTKE